MTSTLLDAKPAALTEPECSELAHCEAVIERGRQAFVEVGNALLAIRDKRLYRSTHDTFEGYCRERWDISRPRAYQLIEAAQLVSGLSTNVDKPPANEGQARELAAVPAEQRQEVWREAVETAPNGKVTGAHVKAVVERHSAPATACSGTSAAEPEAPALMLAIATAETAPPIRKPQEEAGDAVLLPPEGGIWFESHPAQRDTLHPTARLFVEGVLKGLQISDVGTVRERLERLIEPYSLHVRRDRK